MSKTEAEQARAIADAQKQFQALWRLFKPLPLLAEALAGIGDLQQAGRTARDTLEALRAEIELTNKANTIAQANNAALTKSLASIEQGIADDKAAVDLWIAEAKGKCIQECDDLRAEAEAGILTAEVMAEEQQGIADMKLAGVEKDTVAAKEKLAQVNAALDVAREKLG